MYRQSGAWVIFILLALIIVVLNAAIFSGIGFGIYLLFQWLGKQ